MSTATVLALTKSWEPHQWLPVEEAMILESVNKVLDHLGEDIILYRGGVNRVTGQQSSLITSSIIVVDGAPDSSHFKRPALTNSYLFKRDRYVCAYCGHTFKPDLLTRDHYHPTSKGGKDIWTNVLTACKGCNSLKGNLVPGELLPHGILGPQANRRMDPLYVPYMPCKAESMILRGRNIKADQMAFLLERVKNKDSRMFKYAEDLFGHDFVAT